MGQVAIDHEAVEATSLSTETAGELSGESLLSFLASKLEQVLLNMLAASLKLPHTFKMLKLFTRTESRSAQLEAVQGGQDNEARKRLDELKRKTDVLATAQQAARQEESSPRANPVQLAQALSRQVTKKAQSGSSSAASDGVPTFRYVTKASLLPTSAHQRDITYQTCLCCASSIPQ